MGFIKKEATNNDYMKKVAKLSTDHPGEPYKWHNGFVCYKAEFLYPHGP